MIRNIAVLSLIIGFVASAAVEKLSNPEEFGPIGFGTAHDYTAAHVIDELSNHELIPHSASFLGDVISAVAGYKSAALSLAVKVIGWLVKNAIVVVIGAIVTLGFCKITGKCTLDYEQYEPVAQFRTLVTPERLETAQNFLVTAVKKYAQSKKRRPIKKAHSDS